MSARPVRSRGTPSFSNPTETPQNSTSSSSAPTVRLTVLRYIVHITWGQLCNPSPPQQQRDRLQVRPRVTPLSRPHRPVEVAEQDDRRAERLREQGSDLQGSVGVVALNSQRFVPLSRRGREAVQIRRGQFLRVHRILPLITCTRLWTAARRCPWTAFGDRAAAAQAPGAPVHRVRDAHGQVARGIGISPHSVDTYVKRVQSDFGIGKAEPELARVAHGLQPL